MSTTALHRTASPTTLSLLNRGLPSLHQKALNPYAPVAKWLLGTSAMVAGIVHVGGVTRLTKSGLSMTDWKPLGSLPPISDEEWAVEFERYKLFPEWQQRKSMGVEEFKTIYYWEWGHRMLGRTVGLMFALPWGYFAYRGLIPHGYSNRMRVLFTMGGTQGLVGWWMVKSGLGDNRRGDRREIRVSPYRLATHLGMAFSTYSLLLWTGLGVLQFPNDHGANQTSVKLTQLARSLTHSALQHARRVRAASIGVTGLTALTVVSGAFVAGNDAGNAYNTFPKMDGRWMPTDDMIDPDLTPVYRNATENTAMVQWNHRVLGTSTAVSAIALAGLGLGMRRGGVTPQARRGLGVLGGVAVGQMSLGVATLVNYVPLGLAAAHQVGALVVLSTGIYVVHSMRYVSPAVLRSIGKVGVGVRTGVASGGGGGMSGVGALANVGVRLGALGMVGKSKVAMKILK